MDIYTASDARNGFYRLIDHVAQEHAPICIKGKRNNVVVIAEEDLNAIQETLYLLSIPGMRESILAGKNEPIDQCADQLDW